MKDPFQQATDHRHKLRKLLADLPSREGKPMAVARAVCFPDINIHKLVLAPDAPPEIVIDKAEMKDLVGGIDRILDYHEGESADAAPGSRR